MNLKRFHIEGEEEEKKTYVTANKFPIEVKYKIFNDQLIIDLKELVDGILDKQGISKHKTERLEFQIPFDTNKVVAGDSIIIGIDKKRFLIRVPSGEVVYSKQQKIDYDNTQPHRWKVPQWLKYIENLFYKYYGFNTMELDVEDCSHLKRSKVYGYIRSIVNKVMSIKAFTCDAKSVTEYLDWVYSTKSGKININLGFLNSDAVIQDWVHHKVKNTVSTDKKVRKWDE